MGSMASVSVGRSLCCQLVHPFVGSQPSLTAKTYVSAVATRKLGTAKPTLEKILTA